MRRTAVPVQLHIPRACELCAGAFEFEHERPRDGRALIQIYAADVPRAVCALVGVVSRGVYVLDRGGAGELLNWSRSVRADG